jgi:hypothetical protein
MAVFTGNKHKGKTQKERIQEITDQLEAGVVVVFQSDAYKAYLKCMSKFHNYTEVPVHCRMILQCDGFVM